MTLSSPSLERPAPRLTRQNVAALGIAALAWAGVIAYGLDMGNGVGTMGLTLGAFVAMWSLMMTAMMLPAVSPVGSLYLRTIDSHRLSRVTLFVGGYLLVWSAVGIPVYVALRVVDDRIADDQDALRLLAVVLLVTAGVYQLTPLKRVCLRHCRSPLAQLLHYGNVKGRAKDLGVAVHHAAFCLGCCWALMALFIGLGVMNVWLMFGLATIVLSEKLARRGELIGRLAGAAFLALALLVAVSPRVADAVVPSMDDDAVEMEAM